jgi:NitT/TauT family transport system permease protein
MKLSEELVPVTTVTSSKTGRKNIFGLLRMGAQLGRASFLLIASAVFASLLILWYAATASGAVPPLFLPSPGAVWSRLAGLGANGTLWGDISISVYRVFVGFVIASLMAVPIGVLLGCYRFWEAALEPIADFIRYMPVVAFLPLTILWAGTGDFQKFLIIWIGTFFQQILMVMDNVKRIPADFVGLGRTLGLSELKLQTKIVIPCALPGIWDTLRITFGWAWTWLVVAELVAANSGLGYRITVSQRYFQTDTTIGYILVLGILGLITDQGMKALAFVFFRYNRPQK